MIGEENCDTITTEIEPNTENIKSEQVPIDLQSVPSSDICVFIDPLDATKEYTLGKYTTRMINC